VVDSTAGSPVLTQPLTSGIFFYFHFLLALCVVDSTAGSFVLTQPLT
jgi:cystathionine beta-lyase/cystathionine gamma-synthase